MAIGGKQRGWSGGGGHVDTHTLRTRTGHVPRIHAHVQDKHVVQTRSHTHSVHPNSAPPVTFQIKTLKLNRFSSSLSHSKHIK